MADLSDFTNRGKYIAGPLTEETKKKAMTAIAGSEHCRGADDARDIFEALGLIPYRYEEELMG